MLLSLNRCQKCNQNKFKTLKILIKFRIFKRKKPKQVSLNNNLKLLKKRMLHSKKCNKKKMKKLNSFNMMKMQNLKLLEIQNIINLFKMKIN